MSPMAEDTVTVSRADFNELWMAWTEHREMDDDVFYRFALLIHGEEAVERYIASVEAG